MEKLSPLIRKTRAHKTCSILKTNYQSTSHSCMTKEVEIHTTKYLCFQIHHTSKFIFSDTQSFLELLGRDLQLACNLQTVLRHLGKLSLLL